LAWQPPSSLGREQLTLIFCFFYLKKNKKKFMSDDLWTICIFLHTERERKKK
jgi:hypothetical protein